MADARERLRDYLGLERNILAVSTCMLLLGFGENLWKKFIPRYLQALGAPVVAVGAYGSLEDFADGLYQYPGGWLSDRVGRRNALFVLVAAAMLGYAIDWSAAAWPVVVAGLFFVMAWQSMASPTLFAVVGDALPRERRAIGFTVQSILRRVPIVVAPTLGGILIERQGVIHGMRTALLIAIGVGAVTLLAVRRVSLPPVRDAQPVDARGVWKRFRPELRALLLSDVFIRTCEGMVDIFLVLWATSVVGISTAQFGILIGVQAATSMLVYIPVAKMSDRLGRTRWVVATFLAFSLFPLSVIAARSFAALVAAFVVGGLREIGEPSRKALIIDLLPADIRGRGVGLYYLIRSLAISPAAFAGGLLWKVSPAWPFVVAAGFGLVGTAIYSWASDDNRGNRASSSASSSHGSPAGSSG